MQYCFLVTNQIFPRSPRSLLNSYQQAMGKVGKRWKIDFVLLGKAILNLQLKTSFLFCCYTIPYKKLSGLGFFHIHSKSAHDAYYPGAPPQGKKASVSSWQHSNEIHTLLANIDPSEWELSEFHWSTQAGGLLSCRQREKGEKLSRDKDPEYKPSRFERKDTWLSKLRAAAF